MHLSNTKRTSFFSLGPSWHLALDGLSKKEGLLSIFECLMMDYCSISMYTFCVGGHVENPPLCCTKLTSEDCMGKCVDCPIPNLAGNIYIPDFLATRPNIKQWISV